MADDGPARTVGEWVMYGLRVESQVQGVYRPFIPITRRLYEPPWLWQDEDMDRQRVSMESPARPEEDTGVDTGHDGDRRAPYGRREAPTTGFFGLACRYYLDHLASLRAGGGRGYGGGDGGGGGRTGGEADEYPGRPELLRDLRSGKLFKDLGLGTDIEPLKPHDNYAAYLHGELNPEWVKAHPCYKEVKLRARERDRTEFTKGWTPGRKRRGAKGVCRSSGHPRPCVSKTESSSPSMHGRRDQGDASYVKGRGGGGTGEGERGNA